ncbi:acyl-CoA thioesterase/bile acid-CoA:amino acid N-acyltransferase family protein [Streptomyces sp. NPDC005963]|uniref:acyl-CoA thioesterase/bile acid-CoA:amino acid N-acyltransferase family protein n=1 Tax=Streptomyces sp. NPDC005963 TaxID=3156721 RepID=UPI0033D136FE
MTPGLRTAAVAIGIVLLATGCAGGSEDRDQVRIRVDKSVALADEPIRIQITGLGAGQEVTVTSQAADHSGMQWSGRAAFTADRTGTVDLTRARPRSGTYQTPDAMGLFWSMNPQRGPADESWFYPSWPEAQPEYEVRLAVEAGGKRLAAHRLTRTWMREGVTHRPLTVAQDGVHGVLYLPPADAPRRTPVLSFGGSEGGFGDKYAAALLASRGHPVLALCYFGCPERPETLERIELEYFAAGARLLNTRYGTGSQRSAIIGYSRGSEAAQLVAHHYPDLVHDVVLYAPSRQVNGGFPKGDVAWTKGDKPIKPGPIPVNRVRGTVLAIAGGGDELWPAAPAARSIGKERGASGRPHRALIYEGAGHGVGTHPYTAAGLRYENPMVGEVVSMGGTRLSDAQARSESWPQVLSLLRAADGGS